MDDNVPDTIRLFISQNLTEKEIRQIAEQFTRNCIPNRQVLWTGMTRGFPQTWADQHEMQTLTTAMGPLMAADHPQCLQATKSKRAWTKYIHGASAIFAWHITKGDVVTILSQPPPQRFHPAGRTSLQLIEGPILTGKAGNEPVGRIELVHPTVPGASEFFYEFWPHDDARRWVSVFGNMPTAIKWRKVKPPGAFLGVGFSVGFSACITEEASDSSSESTTGVSTPMLQGGQAGEEKIFQQITANEMEILHKRGIAERKHLKDKQTMEVKKLENEVGKKMKQLRETQGKDIISLQVTQTRERTESQNNGRRQMRHKKEVKEMKILQEKLKNDRLELQQEGVKEMKDLKNRHKAERGELEENEAEEIRILRKRQENERLELGQQETEEMKDLKNRHKDEREDLEENKAKEIKALQKRQKIERLELQQAITNLKNRHKAERENIEQEEEKKRETCREKQTEEIERLRNKQAADKRGSFPGENMPLSRQEAEEECRGTQRNRLIFVSMLLLLLSKIGLTLKEAIELVIHLALYQALQWLKGASIDSVVHLI